MRKSFLILMLVLLLPSACLAQNNARMLTSINSQTGTSYTFVPADTTRVTTFNNSNPVAVTLPNGASTGFGAGTMLSVVNLGAGTVTITCASCTINGAATLVLSPNQGAGIYGGAGTNGVNYVTLPSPSGADFATLSGNNTLTGNNTGSGTWTLNGPLNSNNLAAGNVANKYAASSAYRYVDGAGSDSNDGLSPGTAFATPQHCNTMVVALGGGTCDARTLYTYAYSTELDVGQHGSGPGVPVTMLFPPFGTWTCNVAGGTNRCLQVFDRGSAIGTSSGQGNSFSITASATASVVDVCDTEPSPGVGGSYLHMEGFTCTAATGATVSGAVIQIQKLFDLSLVSDVNGIALAASTKALWVHGICCGATVERVKGIGNIAVAGIVPCTIGSSSDVNGGGFIGPMSCTGASSGQNLLAIVQANLGASGGKYHDIYMEANLASDTTTNAVGVTGPGTGIADTIDHLVLGVDQSGSTRYLVNIASGASIILRNVQLGSVSPNAINDHNPGRGTISPGVSAVITDYSTENTCCSLSGYFVKPGLITPTIGGGSTLNHANFISTASVTPTAVSANSCSDQTFTATGTAIADKLGQAIPPNVLGNLSLNAYVRAADQITLHFCNPSGISVTPPSGVYSFVDFN